MPKITFYGTPVSTYVGTPFLVGSMISIADFYLIPIFIYLEQTPQFAAVIANAPKLKAWWNEVKILASVKEICCYISN